MKIRNSAIAIVAGLLLSPTAFAQVFVIGTGLGGECYQQTQLKYGSFTQGERACTRAIREESMTRGNKAATYVNRGILRMRNGQYDKAIEDYVQAIKTKPTLGAAYLNQGAAHIYKRDFAAAITPLDTAIQLETSDIFAAYYNRAIARENTGDLPGAYADFTKSLELKPDWELAELQLSRFIIDSSDG